MFSYRSDFPIFNSHPELIYLDSAATAQKPAVVIETVADFYRTSYANIHRGLYDLSLKSTQKYENSRKTVATFLKASSEKEIIFTRSATESLNLLASSLGIFCSAGDSILLSEAEHHANLVPWQQLAKRQNLQLKFVKNDESGEIDYLDFARQLDSSVRIISITHCSNVLGRFNSLPHLKKIMTEQGSESLLILDASQSAAHSPLSVFELGCDFLVFSSHKLYGPSGVGVLWGREALLEQLPPYQTGGDMIKTVSLEEANWNTLPWKFEAGTGNIEGVVGLGAALDYLEQIGMKEVAAHSAHLSNFCRLSLEKIPSLQIIGDPSPESGIIAFTVEGIHPHDLAGLLGEKQVCIRAGHHCAAPLHQKLGLSASNRISFGLYNTEKDCQEFVIALEEIIKAFSHV